MHSENELIDILCEISQRLERIAVALEGKTAKKNVNISIKETMEDREEKRMASAVLKVLKAIVALDIQVTGDEQPWTTVNQVCILAREILGDKENRFTARKTGDLLRHVWGIEIGRRRSEGYPVYIDKEIINELYEKYLGERGLWA